MFWFDKEHPDVAFCDLRHEDEELCNGQHLVVDPDIEVDFRDMPFESKTFKLVIFDPPHLRGLGETSWLAKKYGRLFPSWEDDIRQGFAECFRVLEDDGVLVFKWNEYDIPLNRILKLTNYEPLIVHKSGKQSKTHWILFMKHRSDES